MSISTSVEEHDQTMTIAVDHGALEGILHVPADAVGVVLFAHGSGSGRHSPRNQYVARVLQDGGLATLLIDLLTEDEADERANVFDIELLAERLQLAAKELARRADTRELPLAFFGASTGAAAALTAAAEMKALVKAVVSRGGRPDLADAVLPEVAAPTLLIMGSLDEGVLELNELALKKLRCIKRLAIVEGATHLFPEPGALEEVARLARSWFLEHLAKTT